MTLTEPNHDPEIVLTRFSKLEFHISDVMLFGCLCEDELLTFRVVFDELSSSLTLAWLGWNIF